MARGARQPSGCAASRRAAGSSACACSTMTGGGRSSDVIRALEYIREKLNDDPKLLRVHGVNLSVGYEFDAEMFACGQSPLCAEVDRLVQSGVVVVTAAGNTGYGTCSAQRRAQGRALEHDQRSRATPRSRITVGVHPPRLAAHLRRLLLLVQGPDRRRPAQARPRRARRADHLVRRRQREEARRAAGSRRSQAAAPTTTGLLRRRQRHQHGRAARLGRHRRVPVDPPRVHRQAAGGQAHLPRRPRRSGASATSRATVCST